MLNLVKQAISHISVTAAYGVTLIVLSTGVQAILPASSSAQVFIPYADPAPAPPKDKAKPVISGTPINLTIPSINFDREVEDGVYNKDDHTWHVSPKGIHYANLSSRANDYSGNTLLYAHNNRFAFGPLTQLDDDATAIVKTDNGYQFTYRLISVSDHEPTDTSIFDYTGQPLLTLQTCTGAFYQIRTFYTFVLEEVNT